MATGPLLGDGLLASRPVLIALVEFEWVLGLCMLFGLYPKRTWQVALACFSAFACVSLYKGLAGDASCGCFGRLEVSPWYTLALDVGAVIALLVWPPSDHAPGDEPNRGDAKRLLGLPRVGGVVAVALLVGVPGGLAMATYRHATLGDDGMIVGPGNVVVLEPEKWVRNRFPLLAFTDIDVDLARGEWVVLLYHHDCPKCEDVLRRDPLFSQGSVADPRGPCLAIIEMPPPSGKLVTSIGSQCIQGRLDSGREWSAETPVRITLVAGRVVKVVKRMIAGG